MNNKKLDKVIKALKRGDDNAFDTMYEETKSIVFYTALDVLKDQALAEDIMQDTYLKVLKELDRYTFNEGFRGWIKTIAKNLSINAYNKRRREVNVTVEDSPYLFETKNDDLEKRYHLNKLLKILDDQERQIVFRHAVDQETHKAIANSMDMPLGTVLWKYQQALKKLRKKGGAL